MARGGGFGFAGAWFAFRFRFGSGAGFAWTVENLDVRVGVSGKFRVRDGDRRLADEDGRG